MLNSFSAIFPHHSCQLRFCIQNVFMIVNHFNSPPSLPMFPSVTVVLFCMAALIFPMGFYIKEVGGQPYKLPNNTVVGSSYVLFVLSIFFTIVGLLFAGKVCLPGWHALLLLLLLFHHLLFLYIWRKSCLTWLIRGRAALFELNKTEGQLFLFFFFHYMWKVKMLLTRGEITELRPSIWFVQRGQDLNWRAVSSFLDDECGKRTEHNNKWIKISWIWRRACYIYTHANT